MSEIWVYLLIKIATFPCRYLPYSWLHALGRALGSIAFLFLAEYRKRALSNLALAKDLRIASEGELIGIAKRSFQNLAINILEYPRFDRESDFSRVIQCENPKAADSLYREGQGIVFFCGHQSNWEVLFLDGSSRMKGIAIGKSIKNKQLYRWVVSIREKLGGRIIAPRNAVKEGLRALRSGSFIGIVGDQGMPDSGYAFPFLGRRAWTSTAPALLACKTHSPIIVATLRRIRGGYRIRYSDPIWPDPKEPVDKEIIRMMDQALTLLQESIKASPGEWLWQHNRWKQQTPQTVYKPYRHDSICIALPQERAALEEILPHLSTLKQIYSVDFLVLLAPQVLEGRCPIAADEVIYYHEPKELKRRDYRFKLVFNFTSYPLDKHYKGLSAFEVLDIPSLYKLASPHLSPGHTLSDVFKRALCRPGTIWHKETAHAS